MNTGPYTETLTGSAAIRSLFTPPPALLRLAGAVHVEAHDEWQATAERRHLSEHSTAQLPRTPTRRTQRWWPSPNS
jgi:hypothetical protein